MKKLSKASKFNWEDIKHFCDTLTEAEDTLTREIVSCISDKWSLWTMSVIAEHRRPMRFSRIMEQVEGISQKSLTKTLRGLERDGLVTREVFAEVPPGSNTPSHHWAPRCSTMSRRSGIGWPRASSAFRAPAPLLTGASPEPQTKAEWAGKTQARDCRGQSLLKPPSNRRRSARRRH